jgi:hypothetical protein
VSGKDQCSKQSYVPLICFCGRIPENWTPEAQHDKKVHQYGIDKVDNKVYKMISGNIQSVYMVVEGKAEDGYVFLIESKLISLCPC